MTITFSLSICPELWLPELFSGRDGNERGMERVLHFLSSMIPHSISLAIVVLQRRQGVRYTATHHVNSPYSAPYCRI